MGMLRFTPEFPERGKIIMEIGNWNWKIELCICRLQLLAVVYDTFSNLEKSKLNGDGEVCICRLQLLAVVYDTFSNLEKSKLRALFLHKREACMHAFRLLVTTKVRIKEYICISFQ